MNRFMSVFLISCALSLLLLPAPGTAAENDAEDVDGGPQRVKAYIAANRQKFAEAPGLSPGPIRNHRMCFSAALL